MLLPAPNLDQMDAHALKQLLQTLEAERQQMQTQYEQATAELQELRAERQQLEHEVAATQEILVRRDQMLACQHDEIRFKDTKIAQLTHEIATLDLSDRSRIDDRIIGNGFATPENGTFSSFHTASTLCGHSTELFRTSSWA